jgi:Uncharacterized protein conserved in bacteria
MKRGCFDSIIYAGILAVAFAASTYFWFSFFIRGKSVPTPKLVGRSIPQAKALASDLGLILMVDNKKDRSAEKIPVGWVAWQNRSEGSLMKRGSRIYVGQSLGPLVLSVPDLSGQSTRTAMLRFTQRNLKLGNLSYIDRHGPQGIVSEDPPQGTIVDAQTAVSLLIAFPPSPVSYVMPDLIDRPLREVRPLLESRGLLVSNVKFEAYPGIRDGIIIRQYPLQGAPVRERDPITLVVSQQEETTIIGQTQ